MGAWRAPHGFADEEYSVVAHLLRVFLTEFVRTTACKERVGDPKPKVLTPGGELEFIGRHCKKLMDASGGRWFQMGARERMDVFAAYTRQGMSTAPVRAANLRMVPDPGERTRRCNWFSSESARSFYITDEETVTLLNAVACVYVADIDPPDLVAQRRP